MNLIQKLKAGHSHLLIIIITGCLVYSNSLRNGYALDDELYALNAGVADKGFRALPDIFSTHTFHDIDEAAYSYRPIPLASFAIEYGLFGKHVHLSHLINLLLYLLGIGMTYKVLVLLLKNPWPAFFATLLFTVHPLHTEVICSLKSRDELLAFLGAMLSFYWAIQYAIRQKAHLLLAVFTWFCIAFFSKHSCAPFLAAIPFALLFFVKAKPRQLIAIVMTMLAALLLFHLLNRYLLPPSNRHLLFHENPLALGVSPGTKLATAFYVLGHYLQLQFFPQPLLFYYGYSYIPIVSWHNGYALLSLGIHLLMLGYVIFHYKKKSLVVFGICFYFIQIAAFSNILKPAPGIMAERFAFAASLGSCLAIAGCLLKMMPDGTSWKILLKHKPLYFVWLLVLLFACRTITRNADWKDKQTLYAHDMPYLKTSAKANLLYGSMLSQKGLETRDRQLVESAKKYYSRATAIIPAYALAWENLGVCAYFLGDYRQALQDFNMAIVTEPAYAKSYFDKGILFQQTKQNGLAEVYYRKAISLDKNFVPGYSFLGKLYQHTGRTADAIRVCEAGTAFDHSDLLHTDLAAYYMQQGDTLTALSHAEQAAEINPKNTERLNSLAYYFSLHGNETKAAHYRSLAAH